VIQIEKFARSLAASTGEFLDHHTSRILPQSRPLAYVGHSRGPHGTGARLLDKTK